MVTNITLLNFTKLLKKQWQ